MDIMIKHSIWVSNNCVFVFLFTLLFLLGCSCTPTPVPEVEGIKPIWSTKLPGKAGTYNDGLIGLAAYNNKLIFHSTYFTGILNDVFEEDNRIHSLDMKTGEIQWTYPASYNKSKPMLFGGAPYQHNEFVVTKMKILGSVKTNKLVCVNIETGEEVLYKEITASNSYGWSTDVVGNGTDFYYFEQTRRNAILCKGNIHSGQTNAVLEVKPIVGFNYTSVSANLIFHKEKNLIISGASEQDTLNSDIYASKNCLYIIDINANKVLNKVFSDSLDSTTSIALIDCDGDKIYAACGLTTICYNLNTQNIDWTYKSTESYNYMTNNVVVNNGIVFLYGDNRYVGLDANTGEKLYQGDIQCGNANAFNGYVYVIARDAKLYILDIKTGKTLHRIICPEEYTSRTGFNTYCKPQVYDDKLYVFGNYHAYCYDAEPKEE